MVSCGSVMDSIYSLIGGHWVNICIIAAAVYDNEELKNEAIAQNEAECRTFAQNITTFCSEIKSSKKLRESLVK